ncbi:MAG: HEAT repeat domain-containing protein [Anaerolineales bacterium]
MQKLQSSLGFTTEDLTANREGELSAAQKDRFSKVPPIGWRILSAMAVVVVIAILAAATASPVAAVLIGILGIGIIILFYTASHGDTPADAPTPVEIIEGTVQRAYNVNPLNNAQPYNIVVRGKRFSLPYEAYEVIEDGTYWRVYHLPPLKQPLSMEPAEAPNQPAYDVPTVPIEDAELTLPEPLNETDDKRLQDALGLLTGERDTVDDAAERARHTVEAMGRGAVPYLVARLDQPAIQTLAAELGADNLPAWLASLRQADTPHEAVEDIIQQTATAAYMPTLQAALEDEHPAVRRGAVFGLWGVGSSAAVPMLENALQDSEAKVQQAALQALGDLQTGADAIATMTDHPDETTRRLALYALHNMDDPRGDAYAFALAESEDEADRLSAVVTLAEKHRDHPRANEALLALLKDDAPAVRQQTASMLLDYPRRDDEFILPLLAVLDDMSLTEEGIAAYQKALADIDMPKVTAYLVEKLQARAADEPLERIMVGALGLHGDNAALDDLITEVRARTDYSPAFYADAVAAITRLADDRANIILRNLAEDEHPPLAKAAQDALNA